MDDGILNELDLTPRSIPDPIRRSKRRWFATGFLVVLLGIFGFVLFKGLTDATLFFLNADEAVQQRDELGDDRFRLQGAVVPGSVVDLDGGVEFSVVWNGVEVGVSHLGSPPDLFADGMPVVAEGKWEGEVFHSDEILVKHDEVYVEDNSDRLDEAEQQAESIG